jgi:hypothetical protein
MNPEVDKLASKLDDYKPEPPAVRWMYPLYDEHKNLDWLPDSLCPDGGCEHEVQGGAIDAMFKCDAAFLEIDAYGVTDRHGYVEELREHGYALTVRNSLPQRVHAVRLLCSAGHLHVQHARISWASNAVIGAGALVVGAVAYALWRALPSTLPRGGGKRKP